MPSISYLPVIVLAAVFVLIAVRQIGGLKLRIWQIMTGGAASVLVLGSVSATEALLSIDLDVMLFLFGMFVVGEALVESGYLYHISYDIFKNARSADTLVLYILFVMGFFSAFLMNDTLAIIGTPLVLFFSRKHNISSKLMLLTLCFSVTIGSVASPIGNPQNLLVAMNGPVDSPFISFLKYLAIPTVINLFLAYLVLKFLYREHFHDEKLESEREELKDASLAAVSRISLMLIFVLVFLKVAGALLGFDFRLTFIALAASAPVIFFSPKRWRILKNIDWHTLIFFASMFVLMESVWGSGVLQYLISGLGADISKTGVILALSVVLSQVLSNVPFVALYLPLLGWTASIKGLMALAAGSTIAGNLFILGAASNVIVIQNAEKRGQTLSFLEFAKAGVPLTIINILVYWGWLVLVG